ncbi:MAG: metallophosphoesterase family protein [Clostridiales bacterium]|nr:metallophosphoesterase family protein [Clostridiales bacterium]
MQKVKTSIKILLAVFAAICVLLGGALLFADKKAQATNTDTVLLEYGSDWKFSYDYVEDYHTVDLSGSSVVSDSYTTGTAPFVYAKYDQYDTSAGTPLAGSHQYYNFTTTLSVTEVPNALRFQILADDAIAVYINGNEVYRNNIVGYNFSKVMFGNKVGTSIGTASEISFNLVTSYLKQGNNVITVILVQDFLEGNDAYFDMKITGVSDFEVESSDMPDTVALTYYDDPMTTRGIAYYTGISLGSADARYRKVGDADWTFVSSEGETWYGRRYHTAALTGLSEGTEYEYQLGSKVLDAWSKTFTFETKSSNDVNGKFSFNFLTDTQSSNAWEFSIWQTLMGYISDNGHDADFLMHGGDIVESSVSVEGLVPEQWREGFNALESTITSTPIVPVAGNHEYSAYAFAKHFNIKYQSFGDNGAYYSFDYGNAHFVVLNTNDVYHAGSGNTVNEYSISRDEQLAWLDNDLANSNKTWKIVAMHFPPITSSSEWFAVNVREKFMPIFAKNEVDLVLDGHTHKYFRSAVYGHSDALVGADQATTIANIKNSVIPESNLVTYTDLSDGTIYTVNPKGTMYVTAKSTNYNVYYQNMSWQSSPEECLYATNPINGKVMNGGSKDDDTGFIMNYMQYVNVEIGTDTMKCNVYNVKASTGETYLWDTYCVLKADAETLNGRIEDLPSDGSVTAQDFDAILSAYSMFDKLGSSDISSQNVAKINSLKAKLPADSIKKIQFTNEIIRVLDTSDVEGYNACVKTYETLSDIEKSYVDTTKLDDMKLTISVSAVELLIKNADAVSVRKLTKADVDEIIEKYNALNDDQKTNVSNYNVLTTLNYKLAAQPVMEKIDLIKTAPNAEVVNQAYEMYMALDASARVYVDNVDVLTAARSIVDADAEIDDESFWRLNNIWLWVVVGGVVIVATAIVVFKLIIVKKSKRSAE